MLARYAATGALGLLLGLIFFLAIMVGSLFV